MNRPLFALLSSRVSAAQSAPRNPVLRTRRRDLERRRVEVLPKFIENRGAKWNELKLGGEFSEWSL